MMTTQALERAARALYRADPENYGTEDDMWSSYVAMARAVLMAVREPGSDAVAAMFDRLDNGALGEDYDTTDVWQAGIRAIFGEGEGE